MGCDDYALYGDGLALEEQDLCEQDLIAQGAETARCTCTAEPTPACVEYLAEP
jgi:hypothetical protein